MLILRVFLCLAGTLLLSVARAQEAPLFPSRLQQVSLTDTEGKKIDAVIHDVWPETRSVRIFVEAQRDSFIVPLDTFDEASQTLLQDWYFKRLAFERLSFKTEENLLGRVASIVNKEGLPTAPTNAINVRVTDNTRNKDISTEIRNSSPYALEGLDVLFALRVVRDISDESATRVSSSRIDRFAYTEHKGVSIPPHASVTLNSDPVALTNYNLRYDIETIFQFANNTQDVRVNRYRAKATDRIIACYVLVLYKGEPVAAYLSHRYLANDIIKLLDGTQIVIPDARKNNPFEPTREPVETIQVR